MMRICGAFVAANAVALGLVMSACIQASGGDGASGQARLPEVVFGMSGGIAGIAKEMTISPDGRLVAEDQRKKTRVEKQLSGSEQQELDRLIQQAKSPTVANASVTPPNRHAALPSVSKSGRCADCIQYHLTVQATTGRSRIVEAGSLEQQSPNNPELIKFLAELLSKVMPP
jgi:hypothetical protein